MEHSNCINSINEGKNDPVIWVLAWHLVDQDQFLAQGYTRSLLQSKSVCVSVLHMQRRVTVLPHLRRMGEERLKTEVIRYYGDGYIKI